MKNEAGSWKEKLMYEDWALLEAGLGRRGNDLKYWLTLLKTP